jgi:hypothetical protein
LYAGWLHVGNLEALRSTAYGQSLLIKLGLLVFVLGLAATNLLLIERKINRRQHDDVAVWSNRLSWTVALEVVLVLGVVIAVGQMTNLQPARDAIVERAQQVSVSFQLDEGRAELLLAPGTVGVNQFRLEIPENQTTDETETLLWLTILSHDDLGTREIQLSRISGDADEYHGSDLSIAGDWQFTLILREQASAPTNVVAEQTIGTSASDIDVPGEPWRFDSTGGVLGLLLLVLGTGGIVVAIFAGRGPTRKERGGLGVAALALGVILLFQARIDPAVALTGAEDVNGVVDPAMIARGEDVYAANCLSCHGVDVQGDGPAGEGMDPQPADFSQPHTMVHLREDLV